MSFACATLRTPDDWTGPMTLTDSDGEPVAPPLTRTWYPYTTLAVCTLYGLVGLIWYDQDVVAGSIRQYPFLGGRFYLAALVVGGLTALVGMAGRRPGALHVERAGLWLLVGVSVGYLIWTPFSVGWRATLPMLFMGGLIAVSGAATALEISARLRMAQRALLRRRKRGA